MLDMHQRLAVVIPAAGKASRMGQLKQLLPWGDLSVLGQTICNCRTVGLHQIVVSTGNRSEAVAAEAERFGVQTVFNADYETGEILSSIKAGVTTLPSDVDACLILLADQPMITPSLIHEIATAANSGPSALIVPAYQGAWGHPVVIGRDYFPALLALPSGARAKDLLLQNQLGLTIHAVDSPNILADLDTPTDYAHWRPT